MHQLLVRKANVARVENRMPRELQQNARAPQHMARRTEFRPHRTLVGQGELVLHLQPGRPSKGKTDVVMTIQGISLHALVPLKHFHDRYAVMQHPVHDGHRRACRIDKQTGKLAEQVGNRPAVVHVSVGDQRDIRRPRQDGQIRKRLTALFFGMKATVQNDARAGSTHNVTVCANFRATA